MKLRSFAVRAFAAAAVATAAVTGVTTTASAAPAPIMHVTLNGPTLAVLGQNDFCNGLIDTVVETDPARRGLATIAFTPRVLNGVGPGWAQNPVCKVKVSITWNLGVLAGQAKEVELLAVQGQTVRTEINPGSGVAMIGMMVGPISMWYNELRPQTSYGAVQAFFLVP
ncbi:hypothetical protein [Prescottella agglutinans]|uniref:Secreted protein n=1 Tax=Prescottella agglutinans TaxID=1644129 RepID=A0ABT6M8E1_9NOCA|nr:hypothetical protein [Prescottella agglutinans]MDH6280577.1 hypothetical protein [Prescottella agglutinans]WFR73600.1 hypothetical protein P9209_08305 [Prescottella defluvii]